MFHLKIRIVLFIIQNLHFSDPLANGSNINIDEDDGKSNEKLTEFDLCSLNQLMQTESISIVTMSKDQ